MNGRRWTVWLAAAGLLLIGERMPAAGAEPSIPPPPKANPSGSPAESADLRYARLQVQLAETNLARVRRMNLKVANAVPANVVAEYQEQLGVARANLDGLLRGARSQQLQDWLRGARATAQMAETRYRTAVAVNQRMAGTVDELEVERLGLRAEMAQLNVERGRAVADKPFEVQIRWQLDLLYDEIQQLQEQLRRAPPSGGVYPLYPLWWY